MGRMKGEGKYVTSISVTPHFWELAKQFNISFSEAVRVGISLMLAEKGVAEYDNNLNLHRKMNMFRVEAETALQKLNKLEAKNASK